MPLVLESADSSAYKCTWAAVEPLSNVSHHTVILKTLFECSWVPEGQWKKRNFFITSLEARLDYLPSETFALCCLCALISAPSIHFGQRLSLRSVCGSLLKCKSCHSVRILRDFFGNEMVITERLQNLKCVSSVLRVPWSSGQENISRALFIAAL